MPQRKAGATAMAATSPAPQALYRDSFAMDTAATLTAGITSHPGEGD